jgi:hypothetical protein
VGGVASDTPETLLRAARRPERGIMSDTFELFSTKDEALAFVRGFEAAVAVIDDDHTSVTAPEQTATGEWRVDFDYYRFD